MEETSEWELTAGCSRRRPRSGDFLCALWVMGIPHPASSKGRRSSVGCGRDPHLRVRLHNTSGVDKAASLPECSPAQCDAGVRVVAASPGQKLVSAHCPGSPPLPGAEPEDLGRELKILSVRVAQNQHGAHPRARETRHRTVLTAAQHKTPSGRETGDPTGDGRAGSRDTSASGAVATTVSPLIPYPKPPPRLSSRPSRT